MRHNTFSPNQWRIWRDRRSLPCCIQYYSLSAFKSNVLMRYHFDKLVANDETSVRILPRTILILDYDEDYSLNHFYRFKYRTALHSALHEFNESIWLARSYCRNERTNQRADFVGHIADVPRTNYHQFRVPTFVALPANFHAVKSDKININWYL